MNNKELARVLPVPVLLKGNQMFLFFFLVWVIFNGQITLEIALFGLVIAAAVYLFIIKFMGYSPKTDIKICKLFFYGIYYTFVLVIEIIKANLSAIRLITTVKYELEPVVVSFDTNLKTEFARVILANSITLTPGTITVSLEDQHLEVHCLDKELADGISDSVFVKLLTKMEGVAEK